MDLDGWLSRFSVVATGDLASPAARSLIAFVTRYAAELASFVEARHGESGDLVILDFRTGRPQASAYPIRPTERIGIRFAAADAMPLVYMLREDFPDTPHQQLAIEGAPRAICIDDRLWAEARLTWTPAELVHRILNWFSRAARGELHDARQPLDPLMIGSPLSFLISRDVVARAADLDLVGVVESEDRQMLRVMPVQQVQARIEDIEPLCLVAYRIPPENMQRLTFAPDNLGSLADMLAQRGIDLFTDLRNRFSGWLGEVKPPAWRINSRFAVIVEMPIIAPDGAQQDGTDLRAFISDQSVGTIAVALGVAMEAAKEEGSKVGYVKPLVPAPVNDEAVRGITAQSAEIHYEFDRTLAAQLAGRGAVDERKAVMVGGGAIGSHVADCLVREGRFLWTVIDHDRLLPHNVARHTGRGPEVTKRKAAMVAQAISDTLDSTAPVGRAIAANVMTGCEAREEIDQALANADLVIDATASVLAARYLSDHAATARRASVFFNPAGESAVLLAEPADRSLTLRDLEAQYLGMVAREEGLSGHLAAPAGTYAYTGACRAITNQIPEARIMTLSGLVSYGLGAAVDHDVAVIRVWSMSGAGAVTVHEAEPAPVETFQAGTWRVSIDRALLERITALRNARLPDETGGVLTGLVDIPAQSIHLVDAAPAPADSVGTAGGFVRGSAGVQGYLDDVLQRTGGQVRYVGEWHSHPTRAGTRPSATDLIQIDWLATLFDMDTLPALMLIAGDRDARIILADRQAVPLGPGAEDGVPQASGGNR
ncbi:ThiF family adenylyltransferase [Oceaniradius stylonematis]|jgi:hypothetical protein|uniref:ThiF family adenylyltransferase n=1 Tax=Oceaniradius stylonematis TaxID=2184161 RepID=UPI0035CF6D44